MENTESTISPNFSLTEETLSWLSIDYSAGTNQSFDLSSTPHATAVPFVPAPHPDPDPLYIVLPITVLYLSIFFTGTIGNISTCIVIARNKSMHTATNYYLFSLAVSDLLLLVSGMPVEIYLVWIKYSYVFGEGFCMLRGMAAEWSTNASVLTITAFTVERYVAICHPFRSHTMSNLSRAIKLILVVWLVGLIFAIPMSLQFGLVIYHELQDAEMCTFKTKLYDHSFEIATFLFFVVPMILITVLYVMIGLKLRQSNMMKRDNGRSIRESSTSGNTGGSSVTKERNCRHHTGRSSRRVLKMLVAVVVAFFICWAPFHIQRLIAIYGTKEDRHTSVSPWMLTVYTLLTYLSGVLYYVSATINPILYNIMSNKFREAFKETLGRSCGRSDFSTQQDQRSYSSLSRSQHRGTVGTFGSRTVGTAGTGAIQDSMDCSSNSLRDESLRRSASVSGQHDIVATLEKNIDTTQRPSFNGIERSSGLTRKISYNLDAPKSNETSLNLLDGSNRLPIVHGRMREKLSPGFRSERSRRWQNGNNDSTNDFTTCNNNRTQSMMRNSSVRHHHHNPHRHHQHCRQFGLRTIETDVPSRKKWWRLFKWLPDTKVFRFRNARTRYSNPADAMVNDIESNREEYSMTSCYVGNGSDQRPV